MGLNSQEESRGIRQGQSQKLASEARANIGRKGMRLQSGKNRAASGHLYRMPLVDMRRLNQFGAGK